VGSVFTGGEVVARNKAFLRSTEYIPKNTANMTPSYFGNTFVMLILVIIHIHSTKIMAFKRGDVVCLKSDLGMPTCQRMTIGGITFDECICLWQTEGEVKSMKIPEEALALCDREE
jgi:hypothetical protein